MAKKPPEETRNRRAVGDESRRDDIETIDDHVEVARESL
jgi:hypothetical protein